MRRSLIGLMRRTLFSLMTGLSLLLCAAACALWVSSGLTGWRWAGGSATLTGTHWELLVGRSLVIEWQEVLFIPPKDGHVQSFGRFSDAEEFPGVHVMRQESLTRPRLPGEEPPFRANAPARLYHKSLKLNVSYLSIAAACSVLPLLWIWRRRSWLRDARMRAGLCPACGYDLRATPGRCPECGTTSPEEF